MKSESNSTKSIRNHENLGKKDDSNFSDNSSNFELQHGIRKKQNKHLKKLNSFQNCRLVGQISIKKLGC